MGPPRIGKKEEEVLTEHVEGEAAGSVGPSAAAWLGLLLLLHLQLAVAARAPPVLHHHALLPSRSVSPPAAATGFEGGGRSQDGAEPQNFMEIEDSDKPLKPAFPIKNLKIAEIKYQEGDERVKTIVKILNQNGVPLENINVLQIRRQSRLF
uniref:Uncharacterized protein n=1 Tax=Leersia perrieri TaxID=77586 RepID=A0A0D9XQ44_9ORYZ